MKTIPLTKGQVALVDDEDYLGLIARGKWTLHNQGYAYRWDRSVKPEKCLLMHRVITNAKRGREVDHINHNRLDNRKINLRVTSRSGNNYNRQKTKGFELASKGWKAYLVRVGFRHKRIYIGYFKEAEEASWVSQQVRNQLMEVI